MIIYRDLISHDEMFSDIYKIREIAGGLCLEVEGKMVSRTEGNIDDSLIGGNASAEGPEGEGTQSTVITGVDIVMNHHLQETSFTKEAYKKYIKDYMKSIKGKLEEQRPERVKPFMTGAAEQKSGRKFVFLKQKVSGGKNKSRRNPKKKKETTFRLQEHIHKRNPRYNKKNNRGQEKMFGN
uniref:Translationally-controlled tumor protein n=1 Tax=Oryctolagus cuniculus TaxID=9986 RepID=A0A5F9CGA7_RABIT